MSTKKSLDWTELDQRAVDTVRVLAMDAVQKVGNGHPGTAMSLAPAATLLFQRYLRHDPTDPGWLGRDRFVLSAGHSSLTLYIQLYLSGYGLELDDLKALRTWGSLTPGHPEHGHTAGVETTTGPLGQGVGNAVGMAMAARRERGLFDPEAPEGESPFDHNVWVIASDGDMEEGISNEASSIAARAAVGQPDPALGRQPHLDRGRHERSPCRRTSPAATRRWAGTCSGSTGSTTTASYHENVQALADAFDAALAVTDRPSFIALRTIIAWPAPNAQNTGKAHGSALGDDEVAATKRLLGLRHRPVRSRSPTQVLAHTREVVDRGRAAHAEWQEKFDAWAGGQPRRQGAARPDVDPPAARGLDVGAARVPRRREGHGHPQGVRQRAHRDRTGAARAVGRLGRPRRVEQHDSRGRAVVPARRPPVQGVPRWSRTAGSCTSGSASTRWARSSTASPCTAGLDRTAARSSSSATTCDQRCVSRP